MLLLLLIRSFAKLLLTSNDSSTLGAMSTTASVIKEEQELPKIEPYHASTTDILWKDMLKGAAEYQVLAIGGSGYVYQYRGFAYKQTCFQRELDMMNAAGDCAVRPVARVMEMCDDRLVMIGLLMELEMPLDLKIVKESEKHILMEEMIAVVNRLHQKFRIVHGDIKPGNMLRCRDCKLRLCDFDAARPIIDEDPQLWEGLCTEQYLAPNRDFFSTGKAPTAEDDLYALGISIWEVWTGKEALKDEWNNIEDVLRERRSVDVGEIRDLEAREIVRGYLRGGGALV